MLRVLRRQLRVHLPALANDPTRNPVATHGAYSHERPDPKGIPEVRRRLRRHCLHGLSRHAARGACIRLLVHAGAHPEPAADLHDQPELARDRPERRRGEATCEPDRRASELRGHRRRDRAARVRALHHRAVGRPRVSRTRTTTSGSTTTTPATSRSEGRTRVSWWSTTNTRRTRSTSSVRARTPASEPPIRRAGNRTFEAATGLALPSAANINELTPDAEAAALRGAVLQHRPVGAPREAQALPRPSSTWSRATRRNRRVHLLSGLASQPGPHRRIPDRDVVGPDPA